MKSLLATALVLTLLTPVWAGSDVPPEGPTWERDLVAAQGKALKAGVPLFLYFTKTY